MALNAAPPAVLKAANKDAARRARVLELEREQKAIERAAEAALRNKEMADGLFEAIKGFVRRNLESPRIMKFYGPHNPTTEYPGGAVVQRSGQTFISLAPTTDVPGHSPMWRQLGKDL